MMIPISDIRAYSDDELLYWHSQYSGRTDLIGSQWSFVKHVDEELRRRGLLSPLPPEIYSGPLPNNGVLRDSSTIVLLLAGVVILMMMAAK